MEGDLAALTWLGTAGFRIEVAGCVLLIDPYLSRPAYARPRLPLTLSDMGPIDAIFLSHGHFDHALDAPRVAARSGAWVYASTDIVETLIRRGVPLDQAVAIDGEGEGSVGPIAFQAFPAGHVTFDLPLIVRTFLRCVRDRVDWSSLFSLWRRWPSGRPLAWRLSWPNGKRSSLSILHIGSAGATEAQLSRLAAVGRPDWLLFPLQGHSQIHQIGLRALKRLKPRVVIPHHHDDFYPPLSQCIDISPFEKSVRGLSFPVHVIAPSIGERIPLGCLSRGEGIGYNSPREP